MAGADAEEMKEFVGELYGIKIYAVDPTVKVRRGKKYERFLETVLTVFRSQLENSKFISSVYYYEAKPRNRRRRKTR